MKDQESSGIFIDTIIKKTIALTLIYTHVFWDLEET